ncbi:MAG: signal peptidase I [Rickettsiales bacterium]|nr:signal peptidase I [Rickettsiales bacterium]|tara:strand:+ start:23414 stop:24031 length:618 start_codon:yes stop_codon:yes gene_type:complete
MLLSSLNVQIPILLFRMFIAEPFVVNSPAMYPTFSVGDYGFINKINYIKQPKRGDVVSFIGKGVPVLYIKRVIGFPGEKIEFIKGVIYINDNPLLLERVEDYTEKTILLTRKRPQYIETLPNGHKHKILRDDPEGNLPSDNMGPYYVPEGHYFMVGDNRNHSGDSRYDSPVGYVPFENFLGPAQFIIRLTDQLPYARLTFLKLTS